MGNYRSKFKQEVRLCWVPNEADKLGLGVPVGRPPDPPGRPWRTEEEGNKSRPLSQASDSQCLEGSSSSAQASRGSRAEPCFGPTQPRTNSRVTRPEGRGREVAMSTVGWELAMEAEKVGAR